MPTSQFKQAVENILTRDSRFELEAYLLLSDALGYAVKKVNQDSTNHRHVSAQELLEGFRSLALKQYGPMAITLLSEWGVSSTEDIGDMVFLLIDEGIFGKQEQDQREDFSGNYSFQEAFVTPFEPKKK